MSTHLHVEHVCDSGDYCGEMKDKDVMINLSGNMPEDGGMDGCNVTLDINVPEPKDPVEMNPTGANSTSVGNNDRLEHCASLVNTLEQKFASVGNNDIWKGLDSNCNGGVKKY